MKTVQPIYDVIKTTLHNTDIFLKVGKKTARVQKVYKNPKGTFIHTSLGEHKVDLFTELYVE